MTTDLETLKALVGSWKESLFVNELIADEEDYDALKRLIERHEAMEEALKRISGRSQRGIDFASSENAHPCNKDRYVAIKFIADEALETGEDK